MSKKKKVPTGRRVQPKVSGPVPDTSPEWHRTGGVCRWNPVSLVLKACSCSSGYQTLTLLMGTKEPAARPAY